MRRHPALLLVLLSACSGVKDDPLVVQILNASGRDLVGFEVSGGGSRIAVDPLPRGKVFKAPFPVTVPGPLLIRYDGRDQPVDFPLGLQHNTAELRITLRAQGPPDLLYRPITRSKPQDTVAGNTADARRLYDLIRPGMPGAEAMELFGQGPPKKPDWGTSRDYGIFNRPETVALVVEIKDGVVSRVFIHLPNGSRKGEIVAQKP